MILEGGEGREGGRCGEVREEGCKGGGRLGRRDYSLAMPV